MADLLDEMDRVVLTEDLPEEDLRAGDEGMIVMVFREGAGDYTGPDGYTVEFAGGFSGGVREYTHANVRPEQVRKASGADAREDAPAKAEA